VGGHPSARTFVLAPLPSAAVAPGTINTREAILERAVDIASTHGLEGLTIGRLASELGLSKSGLFGHFGSKEELQLATVRQAAARFVKSVIEPAYEEPEGRAQLQALCDHYLDHLAAAVFPGGCFWAAAAAEFDGRPGPVRDAVRDAMAAWLGELERQARTAGAEDPGQLAFELQALVAAANSSHQLLDDPAAFDRARHAIDRLLTAIPA
jgi:AcrR family transcriptional regulator